MTTVDELWYLADEASQQAEQTYHRLSEAHEDALEFETTKQVSRRRFRTVAARIEENGAPYGAHALTYSSESELVLVRHAAIDLWVLPGGETDGDEDFREAAARELREEAGLDGTFQGLGMLGRVQFRSGEHSTWGVLPLYQVEATRVEPSVADPDGEITDAQWFDELPEDTRDRAQLERWRESSLASD